LLLPVAALGEALAYHALFQERLSWFVGTPIAISNVKATQGYY